MKKKIADAIMNAKRTTYRHVSKRVHGDTVRFSPEETRRRAEAASATVAVAIARLQGD